MELTGNLKEELDDDELETVSGGMSSRNKDRMIVRNNSSSVALRSQPRVDCKVVVVYMKPGDMVFTYGETKVGTGPRGKACEYLYVCYEGHWGYVNSDYLTYA